MMAPMLQKVAVVLLVLVGSLVALLRLESTSVWMTAASPDPRHSTATTSAGSSAASARGGSIIQTTPVTNLTILPGELPGYTGWARPASTLAHSFQIVGYSTSPTVGQNWTVSVHCDHVKCASGGALFYVRAYGRSVLPGLVTDHQNGTYDVTIVPHDAGRYTLEVVLTFSQAPAWDEFPIEGIGPGYEGYFLSGFPLQLDVAAPNHPSPATASKRQQASFRFCGSSDLLETSPTSAVENSRWLVTSKNVDESFNEYDNKLRPSLVNYRNGINALGIQMEYEHVNGCQMLSDAAVRDPETLAAALRGTNLNSSDLHLVFVGDSNIRKQRDMFQKYFGGGLSETHVVTNGGLFDRLPAIEKELNELAKENKFFVVLFNSGLHDIAQLCIHANATLGSNDNNDMSMSCAHQYRNKLHEFVQVVVAFPAALHVWQTSIAAWPKWGVFGSAWPPHAAQPLPKVPDTCAHFNEIAWDVVQQYNVPVMDTYWMSVSRPDHRFVDANIGLANQLMHVGPELYSVLTRRWAMIILESIRKSSR